MLQMPLGLGLSQLTHQTRNLPDSTEIGAAYPSVDVSWGKLYGRHVFRLCSTPKGTTKPPKQGSVLNNLV